MTRRLFYLNALLLVAAIALGLRLRLLWEEARQREEMVRLNEVKRPVYRAGAPTPQVQALNAMTYSDVAMRMLFSKDRNSTVIVEIPPAKPDPPVPPFPSANGVMTWGGIPRIILTSKGGEGQRIYKPGDKVGDFELVSFDSRKVKFRWNDKDFEKTMEELTVAPQPGAAIAAPAPSSGASGVVVAGTGSSSDPKSSTVDFGNGTRSCAPGDTSPNGTVQGGMKKVIVQNPFGVSCHWEPVK